MVADFRLYGRPLAGAGERCALWKRVSSDGQSTDNQDAKLDGHVAVNGYTVARTFDLPDLSASKGKARHLAALNQVIADMEAGFYTVLVVKHSSRLDRRDEDEQVELLLRVKHAGGRIESVEEPNFGTTDMAGRVVTMIAQFQNAEFSRKLGRDVMDANAVIDAAGGFRGGRPPLGWIVLCGVCGQLKCGEKTHRRTKYLGHELQLESVITEMFERFAEGQASTRVQDWLWKSHGIKRQPGSLTGFENSAGNGLIRKPIYWNGRFEVTDHSEVIRVHRCEPFIGYDLWKAANDSLDSRPMFTVGKSRNRRPRREDYSGALMCGQCGGKAYRNYNAKYGKPRTEATRVYYCRACRLTWDADPADIQVHLVMQANGHPEAKIERIPGSDHGAELDRVKDELRELPARNLSEDEEDKLRAELRAERKRLEALPEIPARRELKLTGRTLGQAWESWSHSDRLAYVRCGEFELRLSRAKEAPKVKVKQLEEESTYLGPDECLT